MTQGSSSSSSSSTRIRSVAVVGSGVSGIQAAAYLLQQGLDVVVFERSSQPGGVWNYSDTPAPEPAWPSTTPSAGDYRPTLPGQTSLHTGPGPALLSDEQLRSAFAPASACWAGITTNIPSGLMVSELAPWPAGTKNLIPHAQVQAYVHALARDHGAHAVTEYSTRVEEVRKADDGKWRVRSVTLRAGGALHERTREFDAVVVASGHNWLPSVPDIPGLADWKRRFPGRLMHSMQYRRPEFARGKTVVVIGCGTSTLNICEELVAVGAKHVIQGVRGQGQLPAHVWPASVRRVPVPVRFELHAHVACDGRSMPPLADDAPLPGKIHLDGGGEEAALEGVDFVILTTGFLNSLPFLSHLHRDDVPPEEAGPLALVTAEGKLTHNLHKDIFYIPDPSLAFVGVPVDVATFNNFAFQAQAVARVFAGKAELPSQDAMRKEYEKRVLDKGLKKKDLHSLKAGGEVAYAKDLVDWCNRDAERFGAEPVRGHPEEWLAARHTFFLQVVALMKGEPGAKWPGSD